MSQRVREDVVRLVLPFAAILAAGGCEVELLSEIPPWPQSMARGLDYAGWTPDAYSSVESDRSLAELAELGATDVAIVATAYMREETSSVVEVLPERTPTDEALRAALGRARALGLRRALKPHVDVVGGAYRGTIEPADPARWFESYREILLHWAALAEEEGCQSLWIGTELESMTAYTERWEHLIEATRAVFSGELVYAANWTDLEAAGTLRLAELVDTLGVDAYFPLSDWPDPTVTDMVVAWQSWLALLERVEQQIGRPLLVTELGCMSRRGAPMSPWDYRGEEPVDLEVQARYYEAALRALPTSSSLRGVYFWSWSITPRGPGDGSHTPRGKPAAEVLRRFWVEAEP